MATVLHRRRSRARPPSPAAASLAAVKRHKIRNEFIPRPGATPVLAAEWGAAGYRGWSILASILVMAYLFRQFLKNFKSHGQIFSLQGGSFLWRIFVSEMFEFATVILLIYFFSFVAFGAERLKLKLPSKRRAIHATMHVVMVAFIVLVMVYILERRYAVSISFRFAVIAHAFVMYMKMVSYLGTNEFLFGLKPTTGGGKKGKTVGLVTESSRSEVNQMDLPALTQALAHRGIDVGAHLECLPGASVEDKARNVLLDLVDLDEYRRTVYPKNVTLIKFIEFSCLPVLVYEPKYPRTRTIDWHNIVEKLLMIAGIIVVEWFLLEHFIVPSVRRLVIEADASYSVLEAMLDLTVPLQLFVVLNFYLVFECILGANAELMRLGDKMTYADWWNATTFEEFSRKWNKPVHEFLLRHVHIELQNWLGVSRSTATIATFVYSIVAHEVILLAMFGIFRPYLGFFSLFQIPLWYIMRSPLFQNRVLGNVVFWSCLTVAWPLMCVLYCREYCLQDPGNCKIY